MTSKTFLTIGSLLALGFGISFLLVPSFVMSIYGIESTAELTMAYRYFATALITVGFVLWPVRLCRDPDVVRPVLIGHAIGDIVGAVVSGWAAISGFTNGLAWLNVVLYVGLTAGAAYCYATMSDRRPYATA